MLRREGGNPLIGKLMSRRADGIADRKDTRVKYADDVAGVRLGNNMALLRHHLLRLAQTHFPGTLYMPYFFVRLKLARTDPHECDPVAMHLIHIRLNLENKSREGFRNRIYDACIGSPRKRRCRHLQEIVQEGFHTEVGECGTEKDR